MKSGTRTGEREEAPMFGMRRRGSISAVFGAAVLAWMPLAADAQQSAKVPRLGWRGNNSPTFPPYEGFREALRDLGYIMARPSPSRRDGREAISIACPRSRANSFASMWICCSWPATRD
jgi:hypothetical protein